MRSVLIIGAGVAGLATALALAGQGWEVGVVERGGATLRTGHGFLLMENGGSALGRLLGGVPALGAEVSTFELQDPAGATLGRAPLGAARGVRHADVLALLRARLPPGVDVEEGVVAAVMPGHDGAGPAVRLGDGRVRRADLIVVADGARSRLRGQVVPGPALGAVRVVEVVGHLHAPFIAEALGPRFLKLQDPRGRRAAGVLPSGAGGVIWFTQVAADELPAAPLDPAALAAWVGARFGDWAGPIPALLASADPAQRYLWRAADLDPLPALHAAGVALVGDAGHPFLPFTSQGVSAALEDALALGDALAAAGPGAEGLQAGLAAYTAGRLPVVSRIVAGGRALQDAFLRGSAASSPALTVPVVHP